MLQPEFSAYLDCLVPDYAAEIAANYAMSASDARLRAEQEITRDLAAGTQTAGQNLLCILNGTDRNDVIGYLWYRSDESQRSVFICDFSILPACQGKGSGREALSAFEAMIHGQGYDEIKLRVAADNARAQHIYEVGGFRVTGLNMSKRIGAMGEQDGEIAGKTGVPIR
jgi:ribosomal protein S18 acetylase RimI-like enzyme